MMLSRMVVSFCTFPSWSPMCMLNSPPPLHVPADGPEHEPGAGLVHLPRPCEAHSILLVQMLLPPPPLQAPRQSVPRPVHRAPGLLPPTHLPGPSSLGLPSPPGKAPPVQAPGCPESRPPSDMAGVPPRPTPTGEWRCQSSSTAVPTSCLRKQPTGADRALGLPGALYWQ